MKSVLCAAVIFVFIFSVSYAVESEPEFNLKYYGSFKKMMHMKKVDGEVDLKAALTGRNIYAVGALKNAEGEIVVHDSKVWLSYGKDGLDRIRHEIPEGEQAMLLVTTDIISLKVLSKKESRYQLL